MSSHPDLDYLSQTQLYRPGRTQIDPDFSTGRWAEPVDFLLAAGYSFFPCRYDDDGFLFRGLQSGLAHALTHGAFGRYEGDDEMCGVEKAMGVYFLTNEVSDAVTVSRLYESPADAAILAIRATAFNRRLDNGEAAVLAVGDGGIVFRYPFTTAGLPVEDIACIFIADQHAEQLPYSSGLSERIITLRGGNRRALEAQLEAAMQQHGISGASPLRSDHYPVR